MERSDEETRPRRIIHRSRRPIPPGWKEVRSRSDRLFGLYHAGHDRWWFRDGDDEMFGICGICRHLSRRPQLDVITSLGEGFGAGHHPNVHSGLGRV